MSKKSLDTDTVTKDPSIPKIEEGKNSQENVGKGSGSKIQLGGSKLQFDDADSKIKAAERKRASIAEKERSIAAKKRSSVEGKEHSSIAEEEGSSIAEKRRSSITETEALSESRANLSATESLLKQTESRKLSDAFQGLDIFVATPSAARPKYAQEVEPKLEEALEDASEIVLEADETDAMPNQSILLEYIDDDMREFTGLDIEEMMPKSKFKDKSFMKLREFFESIISDLDKAQRIGIPLEEIKEEFYYVWDAVQKSHDNLQDLLNKDVLLTIEVADTMAKTRNLIRIAQDDPEVAQRLGRRLETAWNLVDISEEEEKRNTIRLEELEGEITMLNRHIALAAQMEGRSELTELSKIRRKLVDEREAMYKEIALMRTSLALLREKKMRQIDKLTEYQEMIKYADEEAIAQNEALARELARKDRIEINMVETAKQIELKASELEEMEKQMSVANSKIEGLERNMRDQKVLNEAAQRETESTKHKQDKLKGEVESQVALVERLAIDGYKRQAELKAKEDEVLALRMEGVRTERQRISNQKKCEAMQENLDSLEKEREVLKSKILDLEKDLDRAQKRLEESKKEVEELDKQRTVVNRNLLRAAAVTGEHESQIKINSIAVNNLEGELDGFNREIGTQTDTIHRLERERDFYSHEATKLALIVASRLEQIKRLDQSVYEGKKKLADLESLLKVQQQNVEAAQVEKQYYERALRDTNTEMLDASKKIRHVRFERNRFECREHDLKNCILQEKEKYDNFVKEKEFFKTEAHRMKHMAVDIQRETEALEQERSILGSAVAETENEISKQSHYATSALSRKENYHRKLMKKESELKETWEKWRTLHSMVRIGAYHYRNLIKEIREIREQIMGLRKLQLYFKGNTNHIVQLKQEISALENCIAKETCMVNALEYEMKRPINIHRWRVLEAVDPDAYQMVKKINIVTKRLVNHNEDIRRQNLRISDQERVLVDIKGVIKRLPGLETPEEREYYEVLYEAKKAQLNSLKHEIYANESHTEFFRNQVIQLSKKMEDIKKEYFQKKEAELCRRTQGQDRVCKGLKRKTRRRTVEDLEEQIEHLKEERRNSLKEPNEQPSVVSIYAEEEEWEGEGSTSQLTPRDGIASLIQDKLLADVYLEEAKRDMQLDATDE